MLDIAIREIRTGARGFDRDEIYALAINEGYSALHATQLSLALNDAVVTEWQSVSSLFDALELQGYGDLINEIVQW